MTAAALPAPLTRYVYAYYAAEDCEVEITLLARNEDEARGMVRARKHGWSAELVEVRTRPTQVRT